MVAVITLEIERIGKVNRLVVVAHRPPFVNAALEQVFQDPSPIAVYIAVTEGIGVVIDILCHLGRFDVARHGLREQKTENGRNAIRL